MQHTFLLGVAVAIVGILILALVAAVVWLTVRSVRHQNYIQGTQHCVENNSNDVITKEGELYRKIETVEKQLYSRCDEIERNSRSGIEKGDDAVEKTLKSYIDSRIDKLQGKGNMNVSLNPYHIPPAESATVMKGPVTVEA
jgi:hypothetical protein